MEDDEEVEMNRYSQGAPHPVVARGAALATIFSAGGDKLRLQRLNLSANRMGE